MEILAFPCSTTVPDGEIEHAVDTSTLQPVSYVCYFVIFREGGSVHNSVEPQLRVFTVAWYLIHSIFKEFQTFAA